jgi:hypothetical protein
MCHFISLITSGVAFSEVDIVLRNNGRKARLSNVQSLQNVMKPLETQFFTYAGECDCGTTLAQFTDTDEFDYAAQLRKFIARVGLIKKPSEL